MSQTLPPPQFHDVLETVGKLPPEDQAALIEIIRQRLIDQRRAELAQDIQETRKAFREGDVQRGSVTDFLKDLEA